MRTIIIRPEKFRYFSPVSAKSRLPHSFRWRRRGEGVVAKSSKSSVKTYRFSVWRGANVFRTRLTGCLAVPEKIRY